MSFNLKHLLFATMLLAIVTACIRHTVDVYNYGIDEAYAEQDAAHLVVRYLKDHDQQWPSSWSDLSNSYMLTFGEGDDDFDTLRDGVHIDFDVTAHELWLLAQAHDRPVFNVIWGRHRTGVTMGEGPNQTIYDFLRSIECPEPFRTKKMSTQTSD